MNLDEIIAIDFHTHAEEPCNCHRDDGYNEFQAGMAAYFKNPAGTSGMLPTVPQTAAYYRERKIAAVIFGVDAERETGFHRHSNEDIARHCAENADILIPFASIDPAKGKMGAREVRRLVRDFGVKGFKFHPTLQAFDPSDEAFTPLFSVIDEMEVPVIFHTGQTGIGSGLPGGRGLRLALSNPMLLDDLAARFPGLDIVMAHPSVPWQDEALAVATHKANVWIDLSGWSPKYFPENLVRQANSILQNKVLFGSDFPLITPDRWLGDFANLTIKDEVRPKILKENAVRLLGLGS